MATTVPDLNSASGSSLERHFQIRERGSTVRTEVLGGFVTFLTMAYIVFVNPAILSRGRDAGGRGRRWPRRWPRRSSRRPWAC